MVGSLEGAIDGPTDGVPVIKVGATVGACVGKGFVGTLVLRPVGFIVDAVVGFGDGWTSGALVGRLSGSTTVVVELVGI